MIGTSVVEQSSNQISIPTNNMGTIGIFSMVVCFVLHRAQNNKSRSQRATSAKNALVALCFDSIVETGGD